MKKNTIVEVDSRDAMFNETFTDIRDRKGRLVRRGVVLPPDLHILPESEFDGPSQDGIIASPASANPVPLSDRFEPLSDSSSSRPSPSVPGSKDPEPVTASPTITPVAPPSHKNWT
jgi:hypothetical protein